MYFTKFFYFYSFSIAKSPHSNWYLKIILNFQTFETIEEEGYVIAEADDAFMADVDDQVVPMDDYLSLSDEDVFFEAEDVVMGWFKPQFYFDPQDHFDFSSPKTSTLF